MRCSICGAKLRNDGDICTNCYKEFQEEEDLKKDTVEKLKLKRKYSIMYVLVKYTELLIIGILASVICISAGGILEALAVVGIFILVFGVLLFLEKRLSIAGKVVFYEKKVVYTFKFLGIDNTKVLKYNDIKDIKYYQTYRQKKFGYGDLCIYANGIIPGSGFVNGFQIKNVENVQESLEKISEIIGRPVKDNKRGIKVNRKKSQ